MLFEPWLLRVSALHSTGVLVHCNRLPREVMRVTIPGAVKKCGDVAPRAMVSGQGGGGLMVGPDDLKRSFPTLTILLFPSSPWQHWDNSNEIWQTSRSLTEKKKKKLLHCCKISSWEVEAQTKETLVEPSHICWAETGTVTKWPSRHLTSAWWERYRTQEELGASCLVGRGDIKGQRTPTCKKPSFFFCFFTVSIFRGKLPLVIWAIKAFESSSLFSCERWDGSVQIAHLKAC